MHPTFPYFFDLLLLFHENALLSLLFHSKMSFTHKNPDFFPCSVRSLGFYKLTSTFIQGARRLTPNFWKRCFLKTSVSNGIIYTKYTQNPHIIEPPFNIATQSATYTVTACVSRWEPNVLNANNPCPAARQKQYWYFISLLRFSALKCKSNGQKNVVVLENLIIESLHMIETES